MRRPHRILLRALAAALLATGVLACDLFGPSGSGVLRARVISPFGAEGAAVLELEGGIGLGPVTSSVGDTYFRHGENRSRIVVVLDTPGEILFTVKTEDIGEVPSVTFVQVADGANQLRPTVDGYVVEFEQLEDFSSKLQRRLP
jgi:hypothetical protein